MIFRGYLIDFRPYIDCFIGPAGAAHSRAVPVRALVDTGATDVCVRPDLVAALPLIVDGEVHTKSVNAVGARPTCRVDLRFENDAGAQWHAQGARALIGIADTGYDIIIGMNVLRHIVLTFDRGVPTIERPD